MTKRQYPLPRNVGAGARLTGRQPWSCVHSRHLAAVCTLGTHVHRALTLGTSGLCWRRVKRGTVTDNGLLGCGVQQSPPRKLSPGGSESESGEGVFWAEGTVCITTRVGRRGCSRVRGKFPSRDRHSPSLACARQTEGQSLSPSLGCFSPEPEGGGTRQCRPFLGVAW